MAPSHIALERDIKRTLERREKAIAIPLGEPSKLLPSYAPDLFSNDYLSLLTNEDLKQSFIYRAANSSRLFGSTGSRLLTGNSVEHIELESRLAKFFNYPSAILLGSGYDANLAFYGAVPGPNDILIIDELIHASAQEGIFVSRLKTRAYQFQHNSVSSFATCLDYVLDRHPDILAGKCTLFIGVESLYSMDGDFCPLEEILDIAESQVPAQSLHVVIDEAHTTGIFGVQGRGLVSLLGLGERVHSVIHTFGKARAFHGAAILTSPLVKSHIANFSKAFIYTTSMPFLHVLALNCSFDYLETPAADELRKRLFSNAKYFYEGLTNKLRDFPTDILHLPKRQFDLSVTRVISPIIPIYTTRCLSLQSFLRDRGYPAQAIPYPMVPRGRERLRVVMHAGNTKNHLDEFINLVQTWAQGELVRGHNEVVQSML